MQRNHAQKTKKKRKNVEGEVGEYNEIFLPFPFAGQNLVQILEKILLGVLVDGNYDVVKIVMRRLLGEEVNESD